jgi:hypothetical protein
MTAEQAFDRLFDHDNDGADDEATNSKEELHPQETTATDSVTQLSEETLLLIEEKRKQAMEKRRSFLESQRTPMSLVQDSVDTSTSESVSIAPDAGQLPAEDLSSKPEASPSEPSKGEVPQVSAGHCQIEAQNEDEGNELLTEEELLKQLNSEQMDED